MDEPKPPSLAKTLIGAGVKRSHAYMIAKGDRDPSLGLALQIYNQTKLQLGPLEGASKREIDTLAEVHSRRSAA